MLTLFHSPMSRSSTIAAQIDAMGIADRVDIKLVSIPRRDGSGGHDPANPHPEGKVPILSHDGQLVWERPAIIAYLSELFPDAPCAIPPGHPERGTFLSWLAWYGDVIEPVLVCQAAGLEHPILTATFRGVKEMNTRLLTALADGRPYLLKAGYSGADALIHAPFALFPEVMPNDPSFRDWVERCANHPSEALIRDRDQADIRKIDRTTHDV